MHTHNHNTQCTQHTQRTHNWPWHGHTHTLTQLHTSDNFFPFYPDIMGTAFFFKNTKEWQHKKKKIKKKILTLLELCVGCVCWSKNLFVRSYFFFARKWREDKEKKKKSGNQKFLNFFFSKLERGRQLSRCRINSTHWAASLANPMPFFFWKKKNFQHTHIHRRRKKKRGHKPYSSKNFFNYKYSSWSLFLEGERERSDETQVEI